MKIKVMYHSRKGNTKKVADAIAQALGQTSEAVPPAYPFENLNVLFLGTGVYFGKVDKKMTEFIRTLNANRVKNVAVFGTMGNQDAGIKMVQELLKAQGINVLDDKFVCRGKTFMFFNTGHPNETDLKEAQDFAKKVVEKLQK